MTLKQEPSRRNEVIRCEQCGEDYSVTYKCCPFCDERPGRPRAGMQGRRVAGANPLQIAGLVISLVLIIAALFIVITTLYPLMGNSDSDSSQGQSSASQSQPAGSSSQSGTGSDSSITQPDGSGDVSQPDIPPVTVTVNSISLDKTDFTLQADESYTFKVAIDPSDAEITWSSSDESVAYVDQNGKVTNVNTGDSKAKATITATAGDKSAQCDVYCRGGSSGEIPQPDPVQPEGQPDVSEPDVSEPVTPEKKIGIVTGATSGLNIRSGPSSSDEAIASLLEGASVTILEDTGTGWYKITFTGNGGKETEGYVSKDFITLK